MELLLCMGCYLVVQLTIKTINGTACLGGLCTRLIYCKTDRVLVQRHAIIRHVCGCYVFLGLLALCAYLKRDQECFILRGVVSRHVYTTQFSTKNGKLYAFWLFIYTTPAFGGLKMLTFENQLCLTTKMWISINSAGICLLCVCTVFLYKVTPTTGLACITF